MTLLTLPRRRAREREGNRGFRLTNLVRRFVRYIFLQRTIPTTRHSGASQARTFIYFSLISLDAPRVLEIQTLPQHYYREGS